MATEKIPGDAVSLLRNGKFYVLLTLAVCGGAGGAGGGTFVYMRTLGQAQLESYARPDPFTGSQANELARRIRALELRVANLPPSELTGDIRVIKSEIKTLQRDLDRHERTHP